MTGVRITARMPRPEVAQSQARAVAACDTRISMSLKTRAFLWESTWPAACEGCACRRWPVRARAGTPPAAGEEQVMSNTIVDSPRPQRTNALAETRVAAPLRGAK